MDATQQLDEVVAALDGLIDQVGPADLDRSTPCEGWKVRDLLEHLAGGAAMFAGLLRGDAPAEPGAASGDDPDPRSAARSSLGDLAAAAHLPGALDRMIDSPFGTMPGDALTRLVALDGTVHTWDLARAMGETFPLPDGIVVEADAFARQNLGPELRGPGAFGPEIAAAPEASAIDRLAAFTGRMP